MVGGGETTRRLRKRCEELGIDTGHLPKPGESPRTWTDRQLEDAVAAATSLHGVFKHLGLVAGGSAWRRMQDHIVRLGLDTSHWAPHGVQPGRDPATRSTSIDDGVLLDVLPEARSLAEVLTAVGENPNNGGAYRRVKRRAEELGLSLDHLPGQAWARGREQANRPRTPLDEILVRESPYRGASSALRLRLVDEGILEPRCDECEIETWNGRPAPLQLDHINGDSRDNRLENLRLLCPNCHALTDTYCGKNIGNGYGSRRGSW